MMLVCSSVDPRVAPNPAISTEPLYGWLEEKAYLIREEYLYELQA